METLADKMVRWGALQGETAALEAEIRAEVMALQQTQKAGNVVATYGQGRGVYDYQAIAATLEPDDNLVERHTKVVTSVDWRGLCGAAGMTDELKARFYTPGAPYVSLKLKLK